MKTSLVYSSTLLLVISCSARIAAGAGRRSDVPALHRPVSFIENRGQWPESVRFAVRQQAMVVHFERDRFTIGLRKGGMRTQVRMIFDGARETVPVEGEVKQTGYHNFFIGSDPAAWRTRVPAYASIRYRGLYDGVDLRARCGEGEAAGLLEYDLLLEAGVNVNTVVIRCEGAEYVETAPDGALLVHTGLGVLRQPPPVAWEELPSGRCRLVACGFLHRDGTSYSFEAAGHDARHPLVIDPRLEWSTFLGGSGWDECLDVAVDESGIVVAGLTRSSDFPTCADPRVVQRECLFPQQLGEMDGFIARLSADGTQLMWGTYLGGTHYDGVYSIAITGAGEIVAAGLAVSDDFPVLPGALDGQFGGPNEAFVVKLNETGTQLLYSTYIGGNHKDLASDIGLYGEDAVCITGFTLSTDFPVGNVWHPGGVFQPQKRGVGDDYDSFVCIVRPELAGQQLLYATYLGGSGSEATRGSDTLGNRIRSRGIAADAAGMVTVVGHTNSADFPVTPDAYQNGLAGDFDGYLTCIDPRAAPDEQVIYSTYLGGDNEDSARAVALSAGPQAGTTTIYVGGLSFSSDFPTKDNALRLVNPGAPDFNDGFLMIFDLELPGTKPQLRYSTLIGGEHYDAVGSLLVHDSGEVTLAGGTWSSDLPVATDAFQNQNAAAGQNTDGYLLRLDPNQSPGKQFKYGTFLGGTGSDSLRALAAFDDCDIVAVGRTSSQDFPTVPGAFQDNYIGLPDDPDGFIARFWLCDDAFRRGDANADGDFNMADAVYILQHLFANGPAVSCPDAADANDDEGVDLADAVYILQHLFANGPAIPPPHPDCGVDMTGHPQGGSNLPACSYDPGLCIGKARKR